MPNHQTSQKDPLAELRVGIRLDAEGTRFLLQHSKAALMLTEMKHAAALQRSAGGSHVFEGIKQRHDEVARLCLNRWRGQVLKAVAGRVLAVFQEPLDAVRCAAEIQQALEKNPISTPMGRLEIRVALHVGGLIVQEDSARKQTNLSGLDLEIVARVQQLAQGSQVLLTEPCALGVVEKCASLGLRLHPHGVVPLRSVGDRFLFELLWADHQPRRPAEQSAETRPTRAPVNSMTQPLPAAAPQGDPLVGTTLGGCKVLERIDSGGMATVYKGEQTALRRCVALKVMKPELLREDPSFVTRFRREAHLAAQLDHPNTVLVYDQGEQSGYYYIVMQFVDGSSLAKLIQNRGRLRVAEALKILMEATKGLVTAHRLKMVHRDIKPGNILITRQGVVKLSDFGLARTVTEQSPLTSTGVAVGTPQYMSPEQCRGEKTDIRSDIYSLGATLFEMLTGHALYTAESAMQIMYQQVHSPIPRVVTVEAGFPAAVVSLLNKMLAKDPRQRYQTPEELMHELRAIISQFKPDQKLSPLPMPATPPAPSAPSVPPVYRSRPPAGLQIPPQHESPGSQQQFYWKLAAVGTGVLALMLLLGLACVTLFHLGSDRDAGAGGTAQQAPPRPVLVNNTPEPSPVGASMASQAQQAAPAAPATGAADSALLRQFQQQQAEAALLAQTGRLRKAKEAYEKARAIGSMMNPKPAGFELLAQRITECDTQLTVPVPAWAKLSTEQIEAAQRDGVRPAIEVELASGTKMRMIYIPAGTFWMGSEDSSDRNTRDERPRHQVSITKGFYMGMTEVTQRQWKAVTSRNPSKYEGDDRPVERVSWIDCLQFIHQINARSQGLCELRLPTEAEWEYCCRAGTTTTYPWGENRMDVARYGNIGDQSIKRIFPNAEPLDFNDGHAVTAPAASYEPNRWGLYDMVGNVLEWCHDCYDENYYQASPSRDPTGPSRSATRVMRGAAWNSTTSVIHPSYRQPATPDVSREYLGLRLAMTVPE